MTHTNTHREHIVKTLIVCTLIVTYLTLGHSKQLDATAESLLRWQTDMIH